MPDRLWLLIWSSFDKINGLVLGLLGLAFGVVAWVWKPEDKVPLWAIVALSVLGLVVLATLFRAIRDVFDALLKARNALEECQRTSRLPRLLYACRPPVVQDMEIALCLLEPSDLFAPDVVVSVFHRAHNNSFERLVGLGHVVTVQADRRIQVALLHSFPGYDEVISRLQNNDSSLLGEMVFKPAVPRQVVESWMRQA